MTLKPTPSVNEILNNSSSDTPLQDYAHEHGLDEFNKALKKNMTHAKSTGPYEVTDNLEGLAPDEKAFFDDICNQMNKFFMGKNGKGYWYDEIIFRYSCFGGFYAMMEKNFQTQQFAMPTAGSMEIFNREWKYAKSETDDFSEETKKMKENGFVPMGKPMLLKTYSYQQNYVKK